MKDTLVAVDLAKDVFEVVVSERQGHVSPKRRLRREGMALFFTQFPTATVVMEACGSAHYWGRRLQDLGHRVVLLPPQYVRPYVVRNKTDRADAMAMLEAYRNGRIKPVPIKNVPQQVLATLHRLRSGWVAERTARINALRGLLREFGFVIPIGASNVLPHAWAILGDPDSALPDALRPSLAEICQEIQDLHERVKRLEHQLEALAQQIPGVKRLRTIPGIGLIIATALWAFVGDVQRFPSGRHLASYLGLTPREYSSGSRHRLGRISKRGDSYLRLLLIHGARSVLCHAKKQSQPDRLRAWALHLEKTSHHNIAAVALANKLVRIAWAVWRNDRDFQSLPNAA